MDELEIRVFDEINDYKEKIYFFNFRQWVFAILIIATVVPTYIFLKDKIGEELTSYIVIAIAGVLGFIGFVKIHELPAEKIIPYWVRQMFLFSKPLKFIKDADFNKKELKKVNKKKPLKVKPKTNIKRPKKPSKEERLLKKAKKKFDKKPKVKNTTKTIKKDNKKVEKSDAETELTKRLSKLPKEQQEALLKLLEK